MRTRLLRSPFSLLVPMMVTLACADGGGGQGDGPRVVVDTLPGDTVVVRTISGSVWGDNMRLIPELSIGVFEGPDEYMLGSVRSLAVSPSGEIYLMDGHVPALRKYSPDGEYITTFGRDGGGPGEYQRPDGGLTVLSDGRVILRDPGNTRLAVYSPEGEYLDGWRMSGGFNTSEPLYRDTADNVYTFVLLEVGLAPWDWTYGLSVYQPDGTHTDTLEAPTWDYERAVVTGQRENSSSSSGVPFSPDTDWTFSPLGYFVGGVSTDYSIDLYKPDGVLRIQREWTPVEVLPDERSERRARITHNFRNNFPGWSWNGPDIPDTKPPYTEIFAGDDGRIWVQLSQRGVARMTSAEASAEEDRTGNPQVRYSEPVAFDVFEADGTYLGAVLAPDGFSTSPTPVFRGDTVWAVVRDELDVQTVVRFGIGAGEGAE